MEGECPNLRWLLALRKLRSSKKVEILQIRLILRVAKWKNIIFYYGWKKQRFFHIFTNEIIFYSAELLICAVNFKFYLNIFIFLNVTQIKHQRSNIWINKQPLISGSSIQRGFISKVSGLQFRKCFWGVFEDFGHIFLTCF